MGLNRETNIATKVLVKGIKFSSILALRRWTKHIYLMS